MLVMSSESSSIDLCKLCVRDVRGEINEKIYEQELLAHVYNVLLIKTSSFDVSSQPPKPYFIDFVCLYWTGMLNKHFKRKIFRIHCSDHKHQTT